MKEIKPEYTHCPKGKTYKEYLEEAARKDFKSYGEYIKKNKINKKTK